MGEKIPYPGEELAREWRSREPGAPGTCFHRALDSWMVLHARGEHGWRIAVGVMGLGLEEPRAHYHAWLERDDSVLSAATGILYERFPYYVIFQIDAASVRRVNPRAIVRRYRGNFTGREAVADLLAAAAVDYQIINGGIYPK